MATTRSLDGSAWEVKGYLGLDGAEVAATRSRETGPGWLPATVPGSVVADLWRAGEVPDPYHERNSLAIEWVAERSWLYRRTVDASGIPAGGRAWLRFEGVDHGAQVFLDGDRIGRHEGMFVPFEIEVGDRLADGASHALAVIVEPAPVTEPQTGRTSRVRVHKSRMSYGWDFSPRMIHQGIWQPVSLVTAGQVRITDVWARPTLAADCRSARVEVAVAVDLDSAGGVTVTAEATGIEGVAARAETHESVGAGRAVVTLSFDVAAPPLWWPNGHGPAPVGTVLVRVTADTGDSDERSVPLSFRRIELVPNEGAPADARPYTFQVNGRRIYAKGWNWVPQDILHGVPRADRIEHLTGLLAEAHVNLVRVWGGGLIETPAFYEACDRRGIMVWQEFIQSSSGIEDTPSDDPAWVELLAREASAIVPLRRNHPSLALWCGGNELQDADGPLDDVRSPALAALASVVHQLDPDRAWLPTSPTGPVFHNRLETLRTEPERLHDVHGPWEHQGLTGQYELGNLGSGLLNSEFGVEGMTNRRTHEALISPGRRWPAGKANPVYLHLGDWWVNEPLVQASFGDRLTDLETLRTASQWLQATGLGYAVEGNRRRWSRNSGSLPWQFNEPYPFAWSTCAVDHRGDAKPAYHAVRRAYAPISVTARFGRAALEGATTFDAAVWAVSDHDVVTGGAVTATLVTAEGERLGEERWTVDLPDDRPLEVGRLAADRGGRAFPDVFFLDLRLADAEGTVVAANRYTFSGAANLGPLFDLQAATVTLDATSDGDCWTIAIHHTAGPAAVALAVSDARPIDARGWAVPSDGGFDLLPGEARSIDVRWRDAPVDGRRLALEGWNVGPIDIA
jgi:beta-mannosidase